MFQETNRRFRAERGLADALKAKKAIEEKYQHKKLKYHEIKERLEKAEEIAEELKRQLTD